MLSLNECRKLIDPKREKYTDEELSQKLSFLTTLAEIIVNHIDHEQRQQQRETRGADGTGIK